MKPIPSPKANPNLNKPKPRGRNRTAPSTQPTEIQNNINLGLTGEEISAIINAMDNPQNTKENTARIIQDRAMNRPLPPHLTQQPLTPSGPELFDMDVENVNKPNLTPSQ